MPRRTQQRARNPTIRTAAKVTYEITNDRVSAIVAALTPALAAAQRDADAKAVAAAYEAKYKAANDCLNKMQSASPDMAKMQSKEYAAMTEKLSSVNERLPRRWQRRSIARPWRCRTRR
jgi:hypothetical protein